MEQNNSRAYLGFTESQMLEAFFRIMETSDDGFGIGDATGKVVYMNDAFVNYLGRSREEILGRPISDIVPATGTTRLLKHRNYVEKNDMTQVDEGQFVDKEPFIVVTRATLEKDGVLFGNVSQMKMVNSTLQLAQDIARLKNELEYYKAKYIETGDTFDSIVGRSDTLEATKAIAKQAAATDFSVLILGESGTGKELFANAIHQASQRRDQPMIRINCAAIPPELMESELFGYDEGAFTGARRSGKQGKFELADGGTLFLDEIGELPLHMQSKLLRALQEGEIEHVGGSRPIPVDVRVIAATNKDLGEEIKQGRFRADLYYRLNVIEMTLPPLRERIEDIPFLIDVFLDEINEKYKSRVVFDKSAIKLLSEYDWPGNIRELRNLVERIYALRASDIITASDCVLPNRNTDLPQYKKYIEAAIEGMKAESTLGKIMASVEREVILDAIAACDGNVQKASKRLGIHRTSLYNKMNALGISRSDASV